MANKGHHRQHSKNKSRKPSHNFDKANSVKRVTSSSKLSKNNPLPLKHSQSKANTGNVKAIDAIQYHGKSTQGTVHLT